MPVSTFNLQYGRNTSWYKSQGLFPVLPTNGCHRTFNISAVITLQPCHIAVRNFKTYSLWDNWVPNMPMGERQYCDVFNRWKCSAIFRLLTSAQNGHFRVEHIFYNIIPVHAVRREQAYFLWQLLPQWSLNVQCVHCTTHIHHTQTVRFSFRFVVICYRLIVPMFFEHHRQCSLCEVALGIMVKRITWICNHEGT